MSTLHGTAIAHNGRAALLLGGSGVGKSGLALQLLALGADLVADDAVTITLSERRVILSCAPSIKGLIEARGIGLLKVNTVEQAALAIVVDLDRTAGTRLPKPEEYAIRGVGFPLVCGKETPNLAAAIWCILRGGQILPEN